MKKTKLIPINELCANYQIEISFFNELQEIGLIEIINANETPCISMETINNVEKMIRMHQDLNINIQGIDVVLNLLKKVEALNNEITSLKNKLRFYQDDF
jgi:hypothetical protein